MLVQLFPQSDHTLQKSNNYNNEFLLLFLLLLLLLLLTGQPKTTRTKSLTELLIGADPDVIIRTRPPSRFCIFLKTRVSQNESLRTMPL